jgi:hypothetical protein
MSFITVSTQMRYVNDVYCSTQGVLCHTGNQVRKRALLHSQIYIADDITTIVIQVTLYTVTQCSMSYIMTYAVDIATVEECIVRVVWVDCKSSRSDLTQYTTTLSPRSHASVSEILSKHRMPSRFHITA